MDNLVIVHVQVATPVFQQLQVYIYHRDSVRRFFKKNSSNFHELICKKKLWNWFMYFISRVFFQVNLKKKILWNFDFTSFLQLDILNFFVAYQRHELTLLRMEDLLNHGSQGSSEATSAPLQNLGVSGRVQTAAELCHRMVDFCQRLTTAKRKILEDPDLYPEVRYSTSRHKLWVLVFLTWYFYKRNSNFLYYFSPVLSIFLHCIIIFAYRSKF